MNAAHVHLVLNHFPVVTFVVASLVALTAAALRNTTVMRTALALIILAGAAGVAAYVSGEPAEEMVEKAQWFNKHVVHEHEEAAEKAFAVGLVAAVLAGVGLAMSFKAHSQQGKFTALAILAALVAASLMAWTAKLGGVIRHDEITSDGFIALPDSAIIAPHDHE